MMLNKVLVKLTILVLLIFSSCQKVGGGEVAAPSEPRPGDTQPSNPQPNPGGTFNKNLQARGNNTCLFVGGSVRCFGEMWQHLTGGQVAPVATDKYKFIALGLKHFCAIAMDDKAVCWSKSDADQSMINDLPPGEKFKFLALGPTKACGIKLDDTVLCWGGDGAGPAGTTKFNTIALNHFNDNGCGIKLDGTLECFDASFASKFDTSDLGKKYKAISMFRNDSFWGISPMGDLRLVVQSYLPSTVGDAPHNYLLQLVGQTKVESIVGGSYDSCTLGTDHIVYEARDRHNNQKSSPGEQYLFITNGGIGCYALRNDGVAKLFTIDSSVRTRFAKDQPGEDELFDSLAMGESHACGVKKSGELKCWGDDSLGRRAGMPARL